MNNEFNGMVKASSQKLETAIAKFDAYKEAAVEAKRVAVEKAKTDKIKVRSWLFFKREVSVWDSITGKFWWQPRYLVALYPDLLTEEQEQFLYYNKNDFEYIKAMVSINVKEVYLSAAQALLVNYWGEK